MVAFPCFHLNYTNAAKTTSRGGFSISNCIKITRPGGFQIMSGRKIPVPEDLYPSRRICNHEWSEDFTG